jgi:actin-related protein 10
MYQYLQTTPIAGHAFLHRLKRLIIAFGSYTPPRQSRRPVRPDPKRTLAQASASETEPETTNPQETVTVPESVLDWLTLEDIRSRGCFVGDIPSQSADRPDESDDLQEYGELFRQSNAAKDATFILRKETLTLDVSPRTVKVPGWVRERAAEVFFETGDVDSASVVEVILSCLTAVSGSSKAVASSDYCDRSRCPWTCEGSWRLPLWCLEEHV